MNPRRRLFRKYVVLIVALVTGALLVSGLSAGYFSYQENKRALSSLQREKALLVAARIEQYVKEIERQIAWTTLPQARSGELALEARRLDCLKLLRQVPAITDISQLNARGREQLRVSRLAMDVVGSNEDFSASPKFLAPKPGKTYFSPVYFRKETEPYMTIAMAWGGEDPGVTLAEVNLKFIWDVVSQIRIGEAGLVYAVDSDGQLIAHPDISLVLQKTNLSALPQIASARTGVGGAIVARDRAGNEVLTAFAPISPAGWFVFVEQPLAEAFAPLYALTLRTALLLLAGLVLSVLASWYLARRMVRPIRALQQGAEEIGAGELSHRIEVGTRDELQSLAEQFNTMAARLEESYANLERKVEERTQQLELATRHKSEFLANMSHELRTPLNAIIGFSEVLKERMFGDLNAKQAEYIDDIHASGRHLLSLINDILDLSKVEAGRMELELAPFDLPTAIHDALTLVHERAKRHGIELNANVDQRLGRFVGDERKLKQILLNLLSNAIKFTPDNGRITIAAMQTNPGIEISVEDTGVGIAPADQEIIFEEFRQAHGARSVEGTGLGLTLTRKFVEMHGGKIWVQSVPGKGSTFTFNLPMQK
ncbi:MAG TPA: sensor histidine kinase, partial [Burkholderiales bacterium]|nr:sensor histidine kinase [Burkholderiales bacterium]